MLELHAIPWVADRMAMVGMRGCSMRWSLGVDGAFVCAVSVSSHNFTSIHQCLSPTVGWRVSDRPLTSLRHLHQCTTFDDSERGGMASAVGVHGVRFNRRTEGPTIVRERALEPVVTLKKRNSPTNTLQPVPPRKTGGGKRCLEDKREIYQRKSGMRWGTEIKGRMGERRGRSVYRGGDRFCESLSFHIWDFHLYRHPAMLREVSQARAAAGSI